MAKALFRLANPATGEQITYTVEVGAQVSDEWWQATQNYFAAPENLPPGTTWETVHRYSLQVEESREIDPSQ
jgi:hypothetical protein